MTDNRKKLNKVCFLKNVENEKTLITIHKIEKKETLGVHAKPKKDVSLYSDFIW